MGTPRGTYLMGQRRLATCADCLSSWSGFLPPPAQIVLAAVIVALWCPVGRTETDAFSLFQDLSRGSAQDAAFEGYEITYPVQVDSSGVFLSHLKPVRRKRDLHSYEGETKVFNNGSISSKFEENARVVGMSSSGVGSRHGPSGSNSRALRLKLSAFAQDFVLDLQLNDELTAPGFTVHRRRGGTTTTEEYIPEVHSCHYHGQLSSHPDSSVAVSLCDGVWPGGTALLYAGCGGERSSLLPVYTCRNILPRYFPCLTPDESKTKPNQNTTQDYRTRELQ